jgi:hypothetical protein
MMKFASFERVVEYIYSTLPKPKHEYGKLVQTEVTQCLFTINDRSRSLVVILLVSSVLSSPILPMSWSPNSTLKDKLVNQLVLL